MPFSYDVTLLRYISDRDIHVRQLINSPVTIGMRGQTDIYTFRRGLILNMEKDETNRGRREDGAKTDFLVYKAKIVPALKLLDYEVKYPVFENVSVLDVLEEVMDGFDGIINFNSYVTQFLTKGPYPRMQYCVQLGETSLAFVHRLLDQFNLWYHFDHDDQNWSDLKTETMILGDRSAYVQGCHVRRHERRDDTASCQGHLKLSAAFHAGAQACVGRQLQHVGSRRPAARRRVRQQPLQRVAGAG